MAEHAYRNMSVPLQSIFVSIREPVARIISHFVMRNELKKGTGSRNLTNFIQSSPYYETFSKLQTLLVLPETRENNTLLNNSTELKRVACEIMSKVAW
eukprot:CAMPEP_0116565004 /NCGR_PEP_ID=MMETSP0397-20121206/13655_1 /TAXON_ID=216820 /ORGANISM="Cyclophora tenuis, Strain ECT3854" /LENGTH=97 /DNA_ID=CAMNT_0004091725 /DNA_START=195 /DNA_END=485 /DNA_ORIENTATION=-